MSTELETRAGLDSLARLHAKRDELVQRSASLYARFGAYGTAEARRKSALSLAAIQIREDAKLTGERLTQGVVDERAHVHPTYLAYLDEMEDGRATWLVLENQTQNITDQIARGPSLARFAAAELSLTPRGV